MLIRIKGLAFSPEGVRVVERGHTDLSIGVRYHDGVVVVSDPYDTIEEAEAERRRMLEEIDAGSGVGPPEKPTGAMTENDRQIMKVATVFFMISLFLLLGGTYAWVGFPESTQGPAILATAGVSLAITTVIIIISAVKSGKEQSS